MGLGCFGQNDRTVLAAWNHMPKQFLIYLHLAQQQHNLKGRLRFTVVHASEVALTEWLSFPYFVPALSDWKDVPLLVFMKQCAGTQAA